MKIIEFIAAATALALIPGPDIIFVFTQSISVGWRKTIFVILGLITGLAVYTTLLALGVGALAASIPYFLTITKYIGVCYLLYLGINGIINAKKKVDQDSEGQKEIGTKNMNLYVRGIIMNLINPKIMIFFLALFTPFLSGDKDNVQNEMIILGLIMMLITFVIFNIASFIGSKVGNTLNNSSKNDYVIPVFSLIIYIAITIMMILS